MVITDLTRSESAGMTGGSEPVNVCSSRAISAQVVLINRSAIDSAVSKVAPSVRNLNSWAEFHESNDMLTELDITTAQGLKVVCWKCYMVGHRGSECPFIYTNTELICPKPGCGGDHHTRDCYRSKGGRARVKAAEDDTKSATSSKPGEASQSAAAPTTRATRSEREKRFDQGNRKSLRHTGLRGALMRLIGAFTTMGLVDLLAPRTWDPSSSQKSSTRWTRPRLCLRKGNEPVAIRLYSLKSESREFVRRFANVGRVIQRQVEDKSTSGIPMRLLNVFSDKVDEFDREHRRTRNSTCSIVDKAVELFDKDRRTNGGKYDVLSYLIDQITAQPDMIYVNGKEISRQVQNGPQKDALELADVVFGTPIGVSDRAFRENFRPHYIFSDENPRDKEITTLILPAHFSPKGYFFFGDHKQLSPIIVSTFAHLKYKPRMSNKSGDDEQPSGVENLVEDDADKEEADKAELTGQVTDILGDHNFRPSKKPPDDEKPVVVTPNKVQRSLCGAQRSPCAREWQKRAAKERDSKGESWVDFDEDQAG